MERLTLDEKLALLGGRAGTGRSGGDGDRAAVAVVGGVPRLGLPALRFADGRAGLRLGGAVAHPAPLALAATWDPDLATEYGAALGEECRAHGVNALLGPAVDVLRAYPAGRSAESFGEDPYLTARVAVPVVRGLQGRHVLAVARHFVLHNQETGRLHLSVQVGDRALHEIHLQPFEDLVRAGVGAVMASGTKVSGTYVSEHAELLTDELRTRMGFEGFVVSDDEGTHSLAAVTSGLSVELPVARYHDEPLRAALAGGRLDLRVVDEHVRRILRSAVAVGLLDHPTGPADRPHPAADGPPPGQPPAGAGQAHGLGRVVRPPGRARWADTARRIAERSVVLLRNERDALPLDPAGLRRVAVVGADGVHGGHGRHGAAWVPGPRWRSLLDGLRQALGAAVEVVPAVAQPVPFLDARPTLDALLLTPPRSAAARPPGGGHRDGDGRVRGLLAEYFASPDLSGQPAVVRVEEVAWASWPSGGPGQGLPEAYSVRWTALLSVPSTGRYTLGVEGFGTCRLHLDGELVAEARGGGVPGAAAGEVTLEHGREYLLRVEYRHGGGFGGLRAFWEPPSRVRHPDVERAAAVAAGCDAAVVLVSTFQCEGVDRPALALPGAQDALVEAVAAANPRTVVVLQTSGPVLLPWVDRVPAVVAGWYGGERAAEALAAVLTGAVAPSGRSPVSFPRSAREIPTADPRRFPGVDGRVDYGEDLLVGYRWYDATGTAPLFPFGHGLAYTTFACSDLRLGDGPVTPGHPVEVSVAVSNTGRRAGTEVVQLYVGAAHALDGPPRQLRGFRRVALRPGETRRVRFTLTYRDFCRWSSEARDWTAPEGSYRLLVGRSSADLPLRAAVTVRPGAGPCAVTLDGPAEVALGSAFGVSATVQNLGPDGVDGLAVALELPDGWTAEATATPPASVPGGAAATASWLARAPARARTGPALLRVVTGYDADGRRARVVSSARVATAYGRLSAAFDNVGVQHEDGPTADFCGTGGAYRGTDLARHGLLPGRTVTCGSLFFTWPRVEAGRPDNVLADGQRIPISCAGKVLAFLGAASGGTATGVGTVTYVDGTTHPYAVVMPDWLANQALPGSQVVATVEQHRAGEPLARRSVSVYAVAVPLLPGKAVTAFTLPVVTPAEVSPPARLHVFGVSIC